jgi:NADH-quinone oxidoreductase subunit L
MTIPLIVLAIGSVVAGFIPFNKLVTSDGKILESELELAVAIPSVLIGLLGIGIAYVMYRKETGIPDKLAARFKYSYKWAFNKFYIDEVYLFVTKKIIFRCISEPVAWFDRHVVDATMNGIAAVTQIVSFRIRRFQSGQLQKYAFVCSNSSLDNHSYPALERYPSGSSGLSFWNGSATINGGNSCVPVSDCPSCGQ